MKKKTLSLVIPVYNEADRLDNLFKALQKGVGSRELRLTEIIFVDDGSSDNTKDTIISAANRLEVSLNVKIQVLSYQENRGKGYAVKEGMKAVRGDYLLVADVDVSTPFDELKKMDKYVSSYTEVIVGTRKNGQSTVIVPQPFYRQILGRGFTLLTQVALNTWISDFTCGFKLISKSAYRMMGNKLTVDRWGYDAEVLFLARIKSYSIVEVPVRWYDDRRSKVRLTKDITRTLVDLAKIRWNGWVGVYADPVKRVNLEKGKSAWQKRIVYTS